MAREIVFQLGFALDFILSGKLGWMYDMHVCLFALAETIHSTESLGHAVIAGEVANYVVCRNVHAYFTRTRADKIDRPLYEIFVLLHVRSKTFEEVRFDESITL